MEKKLEEEDIMEGKNHLVKVWYLFYKWTSIWKGHKTGIWTGNFDMQSSHLAAFAPLFASIYIEQQSTSFQKSLGILNFSNTLAL